MIASGPIRLSVAVVMIAGAAIATWQFGAATSVWQESLRQEIRQAAALREDARFVYADEAPVAFRAATARVRAERLREVRPWSRLAASEYELASQTAFSLTSAAAPGSLLGDGDQLAGGLGYDVAGRLADVRAHNPALRDLRPDLVLAAGDRFALRGAIAAGAVLVLAVAVAVMAARRRQPLVPGNPLPVHPGAAGSRRRAGIAPRLVTWTLLTVLPLAQLWTSAQEQRAQVQAARYAERLSAGIAASGQRAALLSTGLEYVQVADLQATARELAALDAGQDAGAERAVATAEYAAAAAQSRRIAMAMGRAPAPADGVDAAMAAALGSTESDWQSLRSEQTRQADLAERAGYRAAALAGAAALTAVAWAFAVATAGRPRARLSRDRESSQAPPPAEDR